MTLLEKHSPPPHWVDFLHCYQETNSAERSWIIASTSRASPLQKVELVIFRNLEGI